MDMNPNEKFSPAMPINSREEYRRYIRDDLLNSYNGGGFKQWLVNDIYRWTCALRKTEYYINCKRGFFNKAIRLFLIYRFQLLSRKLGFSIPPNVCGPGLSIAHRGTIVINEGVVIGRNCRLHVCVNIGMYKGTPVIGDNVYIGPGAKIFGNISIGDNVAIGANAVVGKSFPSNVTIAGVPAKIISEEGSQNLIPVLRSRVHY